MAPETNATPNGSTDPDDEHTDDTERPAAPFDDLPAIDAPTDQDRSTADVIFPPEAVPDEGPIPDPHYYVSRPVALEVPEWAIEAARWRLAFCDDPDRREAKAFLQEYVMPDPMFVTPDGEDVVELLLEEHRQGGPIDRDA